ncbi:MAG: MASE1 domain-containing protein [Xanthomonadaceae bacterium]|nr:MASE1 domain-containing protein [Xanthomonadaceae bacterium]
MSQKSRWHAGVRHAAVAVVYALGYLLLRQVSWSHWILFAGYRYSVLLLVPYRFWPALVVGEMGPVAYASLSCLDTFGWVWSGLMFVPPLAMAMPIVKFGRDRLGMIPAHGPVRLATVLACAVVVSAIWTSAYLVTLSTAEVPANFPPINYGVDGARWFIGNYLGVLTVAPLVLLVWQGRAKGATRWPDALKRVLHSSLAMETAAFVLPALALLVWLGLDASSEGSRSIARMVMFLPVVWLALRHGWHGAAIGGTMGSVAVAVTMPHLYDTSTLQAEVFVAFATSTMLLFGGRIAALHQQNGAHHKRDRQSFELAWRMQAHCEAQLRQSARGLERVSETVQATDELLLDQLLRRRGHLDDTRELRRRTMVTREQLFQLLDSLYPVSLREQGLRAALRQGGIARALDAHRIGYWCDTQGSIHRLSPSLQLTLHRMVSEGVSHLCATHGVQNVSVHLRSGERGAFRWVVVRIEAKFADDPTHRIDGIPLVQQLAATGLGIDAVKTRAALYEGITHIRHKAHGECISALLREPKACPPEWVAAVEHATWPIPS